MTDRARGIGSPGPSVRVDRSNGVTQVISSPYPLHYATVARSRAIGGRWVVTVHTARVMPRDFGDYHAALHHAGIHVRTLYRVDMSRRFTGPQRLALAMGQCPAHVRCADPGECSIRDSHAHICKRGPEMASVWCRDHIATGERQT